MRCNADLWGLVKQCHADQLSFSAKRACAKLPWNPLDRAVRCEPLVETRDSNRSLGVLSWSKCFAGIAGAVLLNHARNCLRVDARRRVLCPDIRLSAWAAMRCCANHGGLMQLREGFASVQCPAKPGHLWAVVWLCDLHFIPSAGQASRMHMRSPQWKQYLHC